MSGECEREGRHENADSRLTPLLRSVAQDRPLDLNRSE